MQLLKAIEVNKHSGLNDRGIMLYLVAYVEIHDSQRCDLCAHLGYRTWNRSYLRLLGFVNPALAKGLAGSWLAAPVTNV